MYLSIILLVFLQMMTKSRDVYLMYVPNLLNIIIIFLSTPVQDNRYLYANLLIFYLLVIIIIGEYDFKNKKIFSSLTLNSRDNDNKSNQNYDEFSNNPYSNNLNRDLVSHTPEIKETPDEMEARIRAKILKELESGDSTEFSEDFKKR